MKSLIFANRNFKEIIRDPISLIFAICLPIFLLLMITFVQSSANVEIFKIENLTPGIIIFSFSFLSLFLGLLIAKDRTNSFLNRLYASPLKPINYLIGYSIPMIIIALIQIFICYAVAIILGLSFSINIFYSLLIIIPTSLLFIAIGLLLGSAFTDKQVGGVASILINVAAFTSGMWFDFSVMKGTFKSFSYLLPFSHALDASKLIIIGNYNQVYYHLFWVIGYTIIFIILAIFIFKKEMTND